MNTSVLTVFALLILASIVGGRFRARAYLLSGEHRVQSMPIYHGAYTAIWCALPALVVVILWSCAAPIVLKSAIESDLNRLLGPLTADELRIRYLEVVNIARGVLPVEGRAEGIRSIVERYSSSQTSSNYLLSALFLACAAIGAGFGYSRIRPDFGARQAVERVVKAFLLLSASIAVLTTIGIVFALVIESIRFFRLVPIHDFLFGLQWNPHIAIRPDQAGSSGMFGAIPLFAGTFMIAGIAMLIAAPVGLMSAVYLSEYASPNLRRTAKPLLEILAGIPTVVYGFFAALTVGPIVRDIGVKLGLGVSSESALAAGVVMGIMIIPFVCSLSDDVINAVPQGLRDASLALGTTLSETIRKVVLPAALPGIAGALLLAVSRAIGETMIVVMAAGLSANLTANPLEALTTVTVQIVTILIGDQEFESAKTLAAFALGLVLFLITLALNIWALRIVKHFRERYE